MHLRVAHLRERKERELIHYTQALLVKVCHMSVNHLEPAGCVGRYECWVHPAGIRDLGGRRGVEGEDAAK